MIYNGIINRISNTINNRTNKSQVQHYFTQKRVLIYPFPVTSVTM